MPDRIKWIDIARGIGIVLVVIGHNLNNYKLYETSKYIYWFHMPFFFILSGLLHKQRSNQIDFIKSRFKHLMVPYMVFLFILFLTGGTGSYKIKPINYLLGGNFLGGIWWFISCLFFAEIISHYILKIRSKKIVVYITCILYYIAMLIAMINTEFFWTVPVVLLRLPLGIEIVPMATVFYLIGFLLQDKLIDGGKPQNYDIVILFCILSLIIFADRYTGGIIFPWLLAGT